MGIKANADGSGAIQVGGSDAISISTGLNTTFAGTVQASGVATNLYPIVSGTAQTAPPTVPQYFDFTGIPSWVDRITVMFSGVSTSGSSNYLVQLGDSGGIEITGYLSAGAYIAATAVGSTAFTAGFGIPNGSGTAATIMHGAMTISLLNATTNTWTATGNFCNTDSARTLYMAGAKPLSATLDRIRITTVNGSDTFDAGTINILYE
jgi:hypothetical protein